MLPPSIVVKLAEDVRVCRAQLDEAEATAGKLRDDYNGYLILLTFAESQTEQVALAEPDPAPLVAVGPGWCFCGLPGTPGMVHDTDRCTLAVALDERPRGLGWQDPSNWCECGAPDASGMVHAMTRCVPGSADQLPPLPLPASRGRFPFEPFTPANTGTDVPA